MFIRYTAPQKPGRNLFLSHNKTAATEIGGTALQSLQSASRVHKLLTLRCGTGTAELRSLWPLASVKSRVRDGQSHGPREPRARTAGKLTPTGEQETQRPAVQPRALVERVCSQPRGPTRSSELLTTVPGAQGGLSRAGRQVSRRLALRGLLKHQTMTPSLTFPSRIP